MQGHGSVNDFASFVNYAVKLQIDEKKASYLFLHVTEVNGPTQVLSSYRDKREELWAAQFCFRLQEYSPFLLSSDSLIFLMFLCRSEK